MRLLFATLALLAFVNSAYAASDAEIKAKLLGSWGTGEACKEGSLTFKADGTFVSKAGAGGGPDDDLLGTYAVVDGKLKGRAGEIEMPTLSIRFQNDTLMLLDDEDPDYGDTLVRCK